MSNITAHPKVVHAQDFIESQGSVDIHAALIANVESNVLAKAKYRWIIENCQRTAEGAQSILRTLIEYDARATASQECFRKSEIGSPESQHYHYRWDYYLELVQLLRNYIASVMVTGFHAMNRVSE